MKFQTEGPLVQ